MTKVVRPRIDFVERPLHLGARSWRRGPTSPRRGSGSAGSSAGRARSRGAGARRPRACGRARRRSSPGRRGWRIDESRSACARSSARRSRAVGSRRACRRGDSPRIDRANSIGSWKTTPILRRSDGQRQVADVDAVDQDAPLRRVEDAVQEAQRRRFARSRRADQRHGLAGRTSKRQSLHGGPLAVIGEATRPRSRRAPSSGPASTRARADRRTVGRRCRGRRRNLRASAPAGKDEVREVDDLLEAAR